MTETILIGLAVATMAVTALTPAYGESWVPVWFDEHVVPYWQTGSIDDQQVAAILTHIIPEGGLLAPYIMVNSVIHEYKSYGDYTLAFPGSDPVHAYTKIVIKYHVDESLSHMHLDIRDSIVLLDTINPHVDIRGEHVPRDKANVFYSQRGFHIPILGLTGTYNGDCGGYYPSGVIGVYDSSKSTLIHELLHALCVGHSTDPLNIMYSYDADDASEHYNQTNLIIPSR